MLALALRPDPLASGVALGALVGHAVWTWDGALVERLSRWGLLALSLLLELLVVALMSMPSIESVLHAMAVTVVVGLLLESWGAVALFGWWLLVAELDERGVPIYGTALRLATRWTGGEVRWQGPLDLEVHLATQHAALALLTLVAIAQWQLVVFFSQRAVNVTLALMRHYGAIEPSEASSP